MGSVKGEPHLVEGSHHKIARQGNLQNREEFTALRLLLPCVVLRLLFL